MSFLVYFRNKFGELVPQEAKIFYKGQTYFMQEKTNGVFVFTFTNVTNPIDFYVEANDVKSKTQRLSVIKTPTIQNIVLNLDYPAYTQKKDEVVTTQKN